MSDNVEMLEQDRFNAPEEMVAEEPKSQESKAESEKESNLRKLGERAERAERRIMELENTLRQRQQAEMQQPQPVQVEDDDFNIDDDDVPVGRQIKKQFKTLKKQLHETQSRLDELNQRTSIEQAEIKLNNRFKDFNNVVTEDNIRKLAETDPDAYRNIMKSADIYDRGYLAYNFITSKLKKSSNEDVERRLEENKSKPRAAANVSPQSADHPLGKVGDYDRRILTEEDQKRIRANLARIKQYR